MRKDDMVAKFLIVLMFFTLSLSGCATTNNFSTGKDFNADKKEEIIKGKSAKKDILALMGEPNDKGIDEKENEYCAYIYVEENNSVNIWTNSSNGNKRVKKLVVLFDRSDIVLNYVYSDTVNPSSFKFNHY